MLRNLVSARTRSNAGCWTCRLRRKKCDEKRPECDTCSSLEIACWFGDEKPPWMDGGPRQKDMADRIKAQVKRQASHRRHRQYMEVLETGTRSVHLGAGGQGGSAVNGLNGLDNNDDDDNNNNNNNNSSSSISTTGPVYEVLPREGEVNRRDREFGIVEFLTSDRDECDNSHSHSNGWSSSSATTPPDGSNGGDGNDNNNNNNNNNSYSGHESDEMSVHFIMIYLDYIFPYLFPFYRPPVLSGGRGWVLDMLHRNRTVYHTAISLASYFFGTTMSGGKMPLSRCNREMGRRLQDQLEMGLRELHREISRINSRPGGPDVPEKLAAMQSIVNMVVFEVAINSSDSWRVHLDAAMALFTQIIPDPARWSDTLQGLRGRRWPPPSMGARRPWSSDQAALRFFTANLVKMDVLSSIALDRHPRLTSYLDAVAPDLVSPEDRLMASRAGPLALDDFVGLDNATLRVVGAASSLDTWKKEQLRAGRTPTAAELASRASPLIDTLLCRLSALDDLESRAGPPASAVSPYGVADLLFHLGISADRGSHDDPARVAFSRIWLLAILAYLHTIIQGWKPDHPDIKRCVSAVTDAARATPYGPCVRGVALPICIAGCLAPREDETVYRGTISGLGPLHGFGSMKDVVAILDEVWRRRDQLDDSWDVAKCLRVLGHPTLII